MNTAADSFTEGALVEVTQQIPQRDGTWVTKVRGRVVRFEQSKTGSWFAHARDRRLWLDRLTLRKDDGEIVELILDEYTHVEVLEDAPGRPQADPRVSPDAPPEGALDDEPRTP